jgi:alcohol dehydrogenase class IV
MAYSYRIPQVILTGINAHLEFTKLAEIQSKTKSLVITDTVRINSEIEALIISNLKEIGISVTEYQNLDPKITNETVNKATDLCRSEDIDLVIAIGGRKAMHLGRLVAMLSTNKGKMEDYTGFDEIANAPLDSVIIATTASCGVAINTCVCYNDAETDLRYCFSDPKMLPTFAVLDPALTNWLSPQDVAQDGMVSLGYALEALASSIATPITDTCAIQSISSLLKWLPKAYSFSHEISYRENMMYGQQLASMASANVMANLVCKIAGQVESITYIPMGNVVAALLPHVMELFEKEMPEKMAMLKTAILQADNTLDSFNQEQTSISEEIRNIIRRLDMPLQLSFLGLEEDVLESLIYQMDERALATNAPLPTTHKEILALVKLAL